MEQLEQAHTAPRAHLGEAALVIENAQDAVRLQGDEVDAGLVVSEGDLPPANLLAEVLLLQVARLRAYSCPCPATVSQHESI